MPRSDIFHYEGLSYWSPISAEKMERVMELIRPTEDASVLDMGCGKAEFLIRMVERYGVRAVGVDQSPHALQKAATRAKHRLPDATLTFIEQDAKAFTPSQHFDAVSWFGGPYLGAADTFTSTVHACASWLAPGGFLLLGEGFWSAPPPQEYLDATGLDHDAFTTHSQNILIGRAEGLKLLYTCQSNRDEWDEFEGRILYNFERFSHLYFDAHELDAKLDRKRRWNDAQQQWGRDAMGFGLYLFQKPS